jgi:hypothetical protein
MTPIDTSETERLKGLRRTWREDLSLALQMASEIDADPRPDYQAREICLLRALLHVRLLDIPAGFRLDPAEPEWPVLQFELPTGQVSWHMPGHPTAWDGHDAAMKAARIAAFATYLRSEEAR